MSERQARKAVGVNMPSASLRNWQSTRMNCIREIDGQCSASMAFASANPVLAEENVRGYIVLLSAHFQGFCRDLYTEATQFIASKVRTTLQVLIQEQFTSNCMLDHGNPNLHNLKKDFSRFGLRLNLSITDPSNSARLEQLADLNEWRNIAAHHGVVPPGGLPTLADLQAWRAACDGLANSLDTVVYNHLRRILRRLPW